MLRPAMRQPSQNVPSLETASLVASASCVPASSGINGTRIRAKYKTQLKTMKATPMRWHVMLAEQVRSAGASGCLVFWPSMA